MTAEQLSIYLPYKLKAKNYYGEVYTITGMNISDLGILVKMKGLKETDIHGIIPILRPISDLNKEARIGDQITTYIEQVFYDPSYSTIYVKEIFNYPKEDRAVYFATRKKPGDKTPYEKIIEFSSGQPLADYDFIKKLAAFHFDLFGLINKGLAIDINSLKA